MKRIILEVLLILATFSLVSCVISLEMPKMGLIETSDATPTTVPRDGVRLYFKTYTIDEITPEGMVKY